MPLSSPFDRSLPLRCALLALAALAGLGAVALAQSQAQTPPSSPSSDELLADRTRAAIAAGGRAALDNPLGARLGVERDELTAYGRRMVTLLVTVPLARVALETGKGVHEGRVLLFVGGRDSHGQSLRMRRIAVPIHVPDAALAAALEKSAAYRVQLVLPPGASTLAIGLRDELGGGESTLAARYTAGALATARAAGPRTPPRGAP